MTAPRSPDQRARFVRTAASELDVAPELAERLLMLSEAARAHDRTGGTDDTTQQALLDSLLDDDLSRHAWWVAAAEGEVLWRRLLQVALPPRDIGPAVLLAYALARRGAADEALTSLSGVVRPGDFRRSAIELLAELAEDAGQPHRAWTQVARLGLAAPDEEWSTLRCVLGCSRQRQCDRSQLAGVTHARWLRHRIDRWARRPWSVGDIGNPGRGWSEAVSGYLRARATVLPPGERQLLERWTRLQPGPVALIESARWEAIVMDAGGCRRRAGWETAPPPAAKTGVTFDCWLLPTLVPAEYLLARSAAPRSW